MNTYMVAYEVDQKSKKKVRSFCPKFCSTSPTSNITNFQ